MPSPQFGHQFRDEHFSIEHGTRSVNHGSYGNVPKQVFAKYVQHIQDEYKYPDRFFIVEQKDEYVAALKLVASKYLHCDYRSVAFVTNATSGVDTVLRSLKFERGDKLVIFSSIYYACYNIVRFLQKQYGVVPVVIDLNEYPWEDDAVVAKFEAQLQTEGKVKLALFDAVTSMPGVRVPFERLIQVCKRHGVISLIDGAHSIGLIKIDLAAWQPDFYVTNLHKWLYVPRGCAALYVAPPFHGQIQTQPISHSYVDEAETKPTADTLVDKFFFTGTNNYAPIATIKEAVKFREEVCGGEDAIAAYCTGLQADAVRLVQAKWPFARLVDNASGSIRTPSMVNFVVPFDKLCAHYDLHGSARSLDFSNKAETDKAHDYIDRLLLVEYRCRLPFYFTPKGDIWTRLSFQVYNDLSDYDVATDVFGKALRKYFEHHEAKL